MVAIVEKMDDMEMMITGRVLQEILVQAGLAEVHARLRNFKSAVNAELVEHSGRASPQARPRADDVFIVKM